MTNFRQYLASIDLLGIPIAINFSGKEKFRTHFGGICTLLFFGYVIWALYQATQDFFTTVNPKTISSEEYYDTPQQLYLTSDSFPIAVTLSDSHHAPFHNESLFKVRFIYRLYTQTTLPNGTLKDNWKFTPLVKEMCKPEHFGELAWSFDQIHLEHAYCLSKTQPNLTDSNEQIRIQGASTSKRYESVLILVQLCNNSTSDVMCGTEAEQKVGLGGGFFNLFYGNTAINMRNSSRPDQRFKDLYFGMLNTETYKEAVIDLGRIEMKTDSGWIVPENEITTYIKLNKIAESAYDDRRADGSFMACILQVSKLENHHVRSYKKIQDVLAEVGGMANSGLLVILILTGSFLKIKFRETLVNELYDLSAFEDNDNNGKPKKRKNGLVKDKGKNKNVQRRSSDGRKKSQAQNDQYLRPLDIELSLTPNKTKTDKSHTPPIELSPLTGENLIQFTENNRNNQMPRSHAPQQEILEDKAVQSRPISNDKPLMKPKEKSLEKTSKENLEYKEDPDNMHKLKTEKEDQPNSVIKNDDQPNPNNLEGPDIQVSIPIKENGKDENENENENLDEEEEEEDNFSARKSSMVYKKWDKLELTPWEYVCSFVHQTPTIKKKLQILNEGIRSIDDALDALNLVQTLINVENFKRILLDNDQAYLFNNLPRPKLIPQGSKTSDVESDYVEKMTIKFLEQIEEKDEKSEIEKRFLRAYGWSDEEKTFQEKDEHLK